MDDLLREKARQHAAYGAPEGHEVAEGYCRSDALVCPYCFEEPYDVEALLQHVGEDHSFSQRTVKCPLCRRPARDLMQHMLQHTALFQDFACTSMSGAPSTSSAVPHHRPQLQDWHKAAVADGGARSLMLGSRAASSSAAQMQPLPPAPEVQLPGDSRGKLKAGPALVPGMAGASVLQDDPGGKLKGPAEQLESAVPAAPGAASGGPPTAAVDNTASVASDIGALSSTAASASNKAKLKDNQGELSIVAAATAGPASHMQTFAVVRDSAHTFAVSSSGLSLDVQPSAVAGGTKPVDKEAEDHRLEDSLEMRAEFVRQLLLSAFALDRR